MNNNKGYSLTELLLAIFILSVVMLGIAGIMRSTSQFYRNGVQEVRVQEEAQLAVNLVEEMLVDSTAFNSQEVEGVQYVGWNPVAERLLIKDESGKDINITFVEDSNPLRPGKLLLGYYDGGYKTETLADYVTGFDVEGLAPGEDGDNKVVVSVSMNNNGYEYTASKEVYLRNLLENPDISVVTSLTDDDDDDDDDDEWHKSIVLNRFDSYNLTLWCDADSTKPYSSVGDFDNYFVCEVDPYNGSLIVKINDSYNLDFAASSVDGCGVKFKDFDNHEYQVKFSFVTVAPVASSTDDNYLIHREPNQGAVNGQGYQTYLGFDGIDINKAIEGGVGVSAKLELNDGISNPSFTQTLSHQTGIATMPQSQLNFSDCRLQFGIAPDYQANGIIISDVNGGWANNWYTTNIYNSGADAKLTVTLNPNDGSSTSEYIVNYKFRFAGKVF